MKTIMYFGAVLSAAAWLAHGDVWVPRALEPSTSSVARAGAGQDAGVPAAGTNAVSTPSAASGRLPLAPPVVPRTETGTGMPRSGAGGLSAPDSGMRGAGGAGGAAGGAGGAGGAADGARGSGSRDGRFDAGGSPDAGGGGGTRGSGSRLGLLDALGAAGARSPRGDDSTGSGSVPGLDLMSDASYQKLTEPVVLRTTALWRVMGFGLWRGFANLSMWPGEIGRGFTYEFSSEREWYEAMGTSWLAGFGGGLSRMSAGMADILTMGYFGDTRLARGYPDFVWQGDWRYHEKLEQPTMHTVDEPVVPGTPRKIVQPGTGTATVRTSTSRVRTAAPAAPPPPAARAADPALPGGAPRAPRAPR